VRRIPHSIAHFLIPFIPSDILADRYAQGARQQSSGLRRQPGQGVQGFGAVLFGLAGSRGEPAARGGPADVFRILIAYS
jgi:hypothetical protein